MRFVVFEAKYAKTLNNLPDACNFAIDQINKRSYAEDFQDDYDDILCYGIAFFKKRCLVKRKSIIPSALIYPKRVIGIIKPFDIKLRSLH